jgi:hypothetical protein
MQCRSHSLYLLTLHYWLVLLAVLAINSPLFAVSNFPLVFLKLASCSSYLGIKPLRVYDKLDCVFN